MCKNKHCALSIPFPTRVDRGREREGEAGATTAEEGQEGQVFQQPLQLGQHLRLGILRVINGSDLLLAVLPCNNTKFPRHVKVQGFRVKVGR